MNKKTEINRDNSRIKTDKRHGLKPLVLLLLYALCLSLGGCGNAAEAVNAEISEKLSLAEISTAAVDDGKGDADELLLSGYPDTDEKKAAFLSAVPAYAGEPYIEINSNVPYFTSGELMSSEAFEEYSPLDSLGRCGAAYACIGTELMPTEPRGTISEIKPTGWHQAFYPFVENEALYNRCHLIAFQLAGENANERNLITGTRYMNTEGMLYLEELVGDYVRETGQHVLYRVTPLFSGRNLLADGVLMEAESIEDDGAGVTFCVYAYNVQPGVRIDYRTGESRALDAALDAYGADEKTESAHVSGTESGQEAGAEQQLYIINIHTDKFHLPDCKAVSDMNPENRREVYTTRGELLLRGFEPCKICNP